MSFDWEDFATLARELIEASEDSAVPKAAIRAAFGRAYYAVFCVARGMLRDRGLEVPSQSAHATVRRALAESEDARDRRIGRAIVRLFRARVQADYDAAPAMPMTRDFAEEACIVAEDALAAMQPDLADEPDRPEDRQ